LRQFIAKNTLETSEAVATLKAEYFESVRRRNYETSRRIYAGTAGVWPRNLAVIIVGGQSGYVLFDEIRIRVVKQ
jgi:hypothetical protein